MWCSAAITVRLIDMIVSYPLCLLDVQKELRRLFHPKNQKKFRKT